MMGIHLAPTSCTFANPLTTIDLFGPIQRPKTSPYVLLSSWKPVAFSDTCEIPNKMVFLKKNQSYLLADFEAVADHWQGKPAIGRSAIFPPFDFARIGDFHTWVREGTLAGAWSPSGTSKGS